MLENTEKATKFVENMGFEQFSKDEKQFMLSCGQLRLLGKRQGRYQKTYEKRIQKFPGER